MSKSPERNGSAVTKATGLVGGGLAGLGLLGFCAVCGIVPIAGVAGAAGIAGVFGAGAGVIALIVLIGGLMIGRRARRRAACEVPSPPTGGAESATPVGHKVG